MRLSEIDDKREVISRLAVGQDYRYPRGLRTSEAFIDEIPNFYAATVSPGLPAARLERGINGLPATRRGKFSVRPAILIGSSPHKAGSETTPWMDSFDVDHGHVRYFGDNKLGSSRPAALVQGNAALLAEWELHNSGNPAERARACPILLFRRLAVEHREKGYVRFEGVALVEDARLVTQVDAAARRRVEIDGLQGPTTFPNYRFDFLVLDLAAEAETVDWAWIDARRRPGGEDDLSLAPSSWRRWLQDGPASFDAVRRRVYGMPFVGREAQLPARGSREAEVLATIYTHYKLSHGGRGEHEFEAVAELVVQRVLAESGRYKLGWITPRGHDFGVDFVGRLDVGEGFSTARLVVLGQAKCQSPEVATSARDVARTVARLRRGWLGAYVTTSFFSIAAQQEFAEDEYPLVLVNGLQVARIVSTLALEMGYADVKDWLIAVDRRYGGRVRERSPEDVLLAD